MPPALAGLPDYSDASEAELLSMLHDRDELAFVEVYRRTLPAAHGVARRLLSHTSDIEGALRGVYAELWLSPPRIDTPLTQQVRARCFAIAAGILHHRGAAPAKPSVATVVGGLPPATVHHLTAAERTLATMSERTRRAVVLAHDAGVASLDQDDPEAADRLEAALLALSDPVGLPDATEPSGVAGLADSVLGLLPPGGAVQVADAIRGDRRLVQIEALLRRARRRLESLPPTPNTTQRVLAAVLAGPAVPPVAAPAQSPVRPHGVGLIAASIVLVLVAGIVSVFSGPPERPQAAVAQASAAQPAVNPAPVAPREPNPARPRPRRPRIVPPTLRDAHAAPPAAPPVRVTIPKMQVRKRLVGLSILNDGTLAAPEDFDAPGWYREGVTPGDQGPAVIVGHVDSTDGPAVFFKLETLKAGDKAYVKRADGTTVTFVVDRVERYAKDNFPTQQVYGPTPGAELRLITCGGAFDNTTLSYDDNVVAYAHMQQPTSKAKAHKPPNQKRANGRSNGGRDDAAGTYDHLGRLRTSDDHKDRQRQSGGREAAEPAAGA